MTEHEQDDVAGELVASTSPDLLRQAFGAAVSALIESLGDSPACHLALREVIEAERRVRECLARRTFH